jgi:hypothetical protein
MESKTKLVLTRESEWLNRLRGYKVFIDGQKVGAVKNGDTEEFLVQPGMHTLTCKIDWCGSRDYKFEVKEGEVAYAHVRSGMRYWLFFILPTILFYFYYSLDRTEKPQFMVYIMILLFSITGLYLLYYTVFSRKDYLSIEKDTTTLFGK